MARPMLYEGHRKDWTLISLNSRRVNLTQYTRELKRVMIGREALTDSPRAGQHAVPLCGT